MNDLVSHVLITTGEGSAIVLAPTSQMKSQVQVAHKAIRCQSCKGVCVCVHPPPPPPSRRRMGEGSDRKVRWGEKQGQELEAAESRNVPNHWLNSPTVRQSCSHFSETHYVVGSLASRTPEPTVEICSCVELRRKADTCFIVCALHPLVQLGLQLGPTELLWIYFISKWAAKLPC